MLTQFPTATFVSTSVSKSGNGLTVSGNLTLHGVTKPVVLQVDGPTGPINGMNKKPHSGFSATTNVKRTDFGIATGFPTAAVSDDVALTFHFDVAKQEAMAQMDAADPAITLEGRPIQFARVRTVAVRTLSRSSFSRIPQRWGCRQLSAAEDSPEAERRPRTTPLPASTELIDQLGLAVV